MLVQLRQQITNFWTHQTRVQRSVLIALVILGMVLIPLFVTWARTPTYAVAFSGLSETDAGQIVEKLDAQGISYQLRGSTTILVPADKVYDVRLSMATTGLPSGGTVGYELFSANTLGMTEFTQKVTYQRALEGELERTIGSLAAVEAVRVHLVIPEKAILTTEQASTTASVTVKERSSQQLDATQVRSITHLVASSVEGLKPENVVVVDVNGNMLASGEPNGDGANAAQNDSHRNAELSMARDMQIKVQKLLDSALGPNKSVVQASVVMDWTEKETTTQSYDPKTNAVRSNQSTMETYTTTNGTVEGIPGATSNLPSTVSTGSVGAGGAVSYNRVETTTNYEITAVESKEKIAPGQIQRVSLSVLVDGITDATQLATLKSVIAAAVGIDEKRGDMLAVETLAFDRTYLQTQAEDMQKASQTDLYIRIGEAVLAVLILGAVLWYIQRLLTNLRLASSEAWTPVMRPVGEMALTSGGHIPLQGGGSASMLEPRTAAQMAAQTGGEAGATTSPLISRIPKRDMSGATPEFDQLQKMVDKIADDDPSSLATAIQLWLSEDDKASG